MENSKQTFKNLLEFVKIFRKKNRLQREIKEIEKKIQDDKNRILLLKNLNEYIKPNITTDTIKKIIKTMNNDYEERIDEYIIKNAELSKERRDISKKLKTIGKK
ncbi:DUF496 family protein [Candidatus Purcelliella pentastirinorum]|uniref:Pole-localizer protein TmaR n=1 Tax=Candidatus Purcelliella pentastirinorum TaxID=472834 RepID=A0AAX3N7L6_9ENTR|nr:DUF496 family protein [Candidatus Purcelliella pentastirinorum]WDI78409.1 DUF496 family protein [Candidatus Purcelliella pentastirinorum]WDR80562.1 DUF496 family protein [Candidatus Purcelliella pentastirinorum]